MKCFYWKKPLTVCEVGFKTERGALIVKYHNVLTDTVMMDSLKMFVRNNRNFTERN